MTVCAPVVESLLHGRVVQGPLGRPTPLMPSVALHTEEGLGDLQKRVIGGTVWPMAISALFSDIGVLVYKRALVFHVTTGAKSLGGDALEVVIVG